MDARWVIHERDNLWQSYTDILVNVCEYYFETEEFDRVVEFCHQLLDEDPCIEVAHRLLMQVYSSIGRRDRVVQQYNRCREILRDELGVMPSSQTEQLFRTLSS